MRRGVGIFDLSENLWFPNHHRVETRGYPKEVTDGVLADVSIQMRLEKSAGDSLFFCQKRFNPFIGSVEVIGARDDLDPITRGQDSAFLDGLSIDQPTQGGFQ